jgi:hypothetical protein
MRRTGAGLSPPPTANAAGWTCALHERSGVHLGRPGVSAVPKLPTIDRFIRYGVSSELAKKASGVNLTVSSARVNSRKVLVEKFGLSAEEAKAIKIAVVREPIPDDCVDLLLCRSNFTCNVCKGLKSIGFIIHHIVPYEQSQNNNYYNLVVLCPACHDLAHRSIGAG